MTAHANDLAGIGRVDVDVVAGERGDEPLDEGLPCLEANVGQAEARVKFLSRGRGYTTLLTPREVVTALAAARGRAGVLRMRLRGVSRRAELVGLDALPGRVNYLVGNDPHRWRTNVATYARVELSGAYPGVDVVYHGNDQQLEYDFVVAAARPAERSEEERDALLRLLHRSTIGGDTSWPRRA